MPPNQLEPVTGHLVHCQPPPGRLVKDTRHGREVTGLHFDVF